MNKTFNITFRDDITTTGNTTPVKIGDFVTLTFTSIAGGYHDFTVLDDQGNEKLFEVIEQHGKLGIMYPGRDSAGDWHDAQFTPFDLFAWTVIFEIVGA